MTHIKPFKAVHYNPARIDDFFKVVCPPYDVISKDQQNRLHNLSPFNFVNLELAKETPRDDDNNNKYTRAQKTYEDWLRDGVLIEDEKPSIYFYKQEYKVLGEKHSRYGFIALMRLQEDGDARIFPHENTHSAAKEDRLKLWSMLKSNLSSIFVCFSDSKKKVDHIFTKYVSPTKPLMDFMDEEKVRHILWKLEDPDQIHNIQAILEDQPLFIADGHHRYEVAQEYQRLRSRGKPKGGPEAPYDYVMTYFTNMDSNDLQIFPIHRIINKLPKSLDFLEEFFRVDKIKKKEDLAVLLAKSGKTECSIGVYSRDGMHLLRLKNRMLINQHIHEGSEDYRQLDATVLKYFILDRVGVSSDQIIYSKDVNEAMSMVDNSQAQISFVLNPVKVQQIKAIALNGERMPPKTTYFYPKVLSGLTVYKID